MDMEDDVGTSGVQFLDATEIFNSTPEISDTEVEKGNDSSDDNPDKADRKIKKVKRRKSARLASKSFVGLGSVVKIDGEKGKIGLRRSARLDGKRKRSEQEEATEKKPKK